MWHEQPLILFTLKMNTPVALAVVCVSRLAVHETDLADDQLRCPDLA
jgi:DMSO reductase anchor subunit